MPHDASPVAPIRQPGSAPARLSTQTQSTFHTPGSRFSPISEEGGSSGRSSGRTFNDSVGEDGMPHAAEPSFPPVPELVSPFSQSSAQSGGSPRAPDKALGTPSSHAPLQALRAEVAQAKAQMGWGFRGVATGLKMGTLVGAGFGLFAMLCAAPHWGIAFMVLGTAIGLVVGMVAQAQARKKAAAAAGNLRAQTDALRTALRAEGVAGDTPDLREAEAIIAFSESSLSRELGFSAAAAYFRRLGASVKAGLPSGATSVDRQAEAPEQEPLMRSGNVQDHDLPRSASV